MGIDILGIDILGIDILAPTHSIIILTKVYLLITSNLAWLPAAKICLVKHTYLYIAFNLQMAEFVYHKERSNYYKEIRTGYRTFIYDMCLVVT